MKKREKEKEKGKLILVCGLRHILGFALIL